LFRTSTTAVKVNQFASKLERILQKKSVLLVGISYARL